MKCLGFIIEEQSSNAQPRWFPFLPVNGVIIMKYRRYVRLNSNCLEINKSHPMLKAESNYNRANDVAVWPCQRVCGNRILKRLMSPSPKSQVMFGPYSHELVIFFRIFSILGFYATATLLNI